MSARWCALRTFASGFEADLVIARLEALEIPAMRDENDSIGIVGYGFQGATARGVTVRVPDAALDEAQALLRDIDAASDQEPTEDRPDDAPSRRRV